MKTYTAILLLLFTLAASAQEAKFIQKLRQGEPVTIVVLGTSLSVGWPKVMMDDWLNQEFPGQVTLHNLAVAASASQTTPAMTKNKSIFHHCGLDQLAAAIRLKPDVVFIEFAINDAFVKYNISLEDSKKNLNAMIDQLTGCEIILQTMNPVKDGGVRPKLAEYYQGYRDVAKQRGLLLVDNYPNWRRETFPADGVHPTAAAYRRVWLPELKRTLMPQPVDLADLTIDTIHPRIDFFASASVPFGMVALHPDTYESGGLWDCGYRWGDQRVLFFTHSHMVQTPGIPIMPVVGPCQGQRGRDANSSRFSHDQETIGLGYHKVKLLDSGITAEMTASCRVGLSRYTFPKCDEAQVLFELSEKLADVRMTEAFAKQVSPTRIVGYSVQAPTPRRQKPCTIYFAAEFSKPFDGFAGWAPVNGQDGKKSNQLVALKDREIKGQDIGAYVTYRNLKADEQVMLKVGISYVSLEGAATNLEREMPGWDFDAVKQAAAKQWNDYLSRIEVTGGTHAQQVKFYTDLAHTAIGRRIYSDADGRYTDRSGEKPVIRQIPLDAKGQPQWQFIDMDCLWGTQWNLNILWSTVYPDYGNWIAQSLLQYYRDNGILGRGAWGGNEAFTMTGDSSLPMLAALASNQQARFDLEEAYAAGRKNAFPGGVRDHAGYDLQGDGGGMDWYVKLGYVPVEIARRGHGGHREGSSMTLEYAYQDWCLAQMAGQLHKQEDAARFLKRSENWRNVFDASVGWARPRHENGSWVTPFSPIDLKAPQRGFAEASAASYSFYVPQNVPGLIAAMGGQKTFVEKLEMCFQKTEKDRFVRQEPNWYSYLDYGNQPSCDMAYLFSYAGAPWKTQYWVRQVKAKTFGDITPNGGYNGDEDEGQMGALGVLMAIGLFDVRGGVGAVPQLQITSPLFDHITLRLPGRADGTERKTFEISVKRQDAAKDIYIQSVKLNGKPWDNFQFPMRELLNGGNMEIELGPQPNFKWGVGAAANHQ